MLNEMNNQTPDTLDQAFEAIFSDDVTLSEALYQNMALPDSAYLGTRLTKKMLIDSAARNGNPLTAQEKQLISDVIQSVEWRYTLKPDTINIAPLVTEQVEYPEIAIVHLLLKPQHEVSDKALFASFTKLAKLLHKLIPYPLLLVAEHNGAVALSLADKRINQADKTKLVIEHCYCTPWFALNTANNPNRLTANQQAFLLDFSLKNASSIHYYALYQDLIAMLIALETSQVTGCYQAKSQVIRHLVSRLVGDGQSSAHLGNVMPGGVDAADKSNSEKTALLKQLESTEAELNAIRNKLKKETQMNNKMRLNVEARKLKLTIADIKARL
ncbi:hypothetical protein AhyD4_23040 (plasmid) [Aeromonas hydrophila]|uniref:DUF4391 domain-containing protein n=1 Tax=Aeromonas hydrophila TaxID=644 RepID=UPI000744C984|nr:DUF4391 domain-containing protein [Aeromonas hydrophila]ALZ82494.1 hypothetical protein AhyD4_23040 [Aeromonas hydrophila]